MIAGPIRCIDNASLAGATTPNVATSSAVPCYGAEQIDFKLKATAGVAMSAEAVIHVSDDGTNWLTGSGQQVSIRNGTANGFNPQTGVTVSFAPASGLRFGYRFARILVSGNNTAGQNITGLNCDAYVHSNDAIAKNIAQPLA